MSALGYLRKRKPAESTSTNHSNTDHPVEDDQYNNEKPVVEKFDNDSSAGADANAENCWKSRAKNHTLQQRLWLRWKHLRFYTKIIILLWLLHLWVSEIAIKEFQVTRCDWPKHSLSYQTQERILVISDPQLTDLYSYPFFQKNPRFGRFVCWLSDRYMRRNYYWIQKYHKPKYVVIAGDLMDSGTLLF